MTEEEQKAADAQAVAEAEAAKESKKADEKTAEELKAEAEKLEAENKTLKEGKKEEEIRANQERRLEKAKAKNESLKNGDDVEVKSPNTDEIAVDDLVTLRMKGISKDSDEAKLLKQYVDAGIISDYETGLDDSGVKAKIEEIKTSRGAKEVIDENDKADFDLNTKKDTIAKYEASGDVPEDKVQREALAKANLEKMGL